MGEVENNFSDVHSGCNSLSSEVKHNVAICFTQKLQKLIYLHLFVDCFMKISLQSLEQEKSS